MASTRRYTYIRRDGSESRLVGIAAVMIVAATRIIWGDGKFITVKNGGHPERPRSRPDELRSLYHDLKANSKPGDVFRVRGGAGKVILTVREAQPVALYRNPFRGANYSPARIDAGVDYCGTGDVYPIGRAKIINRGTPSHTGTFGNDVAVYQLLDGQAKGLYVFFAEHYENVGQHGGGDIVDVDTPLYRMNGCIEIGWSDGVGSIAWNRYGYREGELSIFGENMNSLLKKLGAKSGLRGGRSTVGHLPRGWPRVWRS